MHRKTAQAHAQQQAREAHIARHLPADADLFALLASFGDRRCHQLQHSRVQGVVQMGHGFVRAIDGQRVLNQVIGADG